jgi:hypothetical protein
MRIPGKLNLNRMTDHLPVSNQINRDFPVPWNYPTIFAFPQLNLTEVARSNSSMTFYDPGPIS